MPVTPLSGWRSVPRHTLNAADKIIDELEDFGGFVEVGFTEQFSNYVFSRRAPMSEVSMANWAVDLLERFDVRVQLLLKEYKFLALWFSGVCHKVD